MVVMDERMKRELAQLESYCKEAKRILQEQQDPSPIAAWAREIIEYGRGVIAQDSLDEQTLGDAYTVLAQITDSVYEHPRLMLELKQLAYDMVVSGEAMTHEVYPIKDDIRQEIDALRANIQAADEGRWHDIHDGHMLASDPVEWSKEYEACIDEADHDAYSHLTDCPRGMGFCFAYWAEKENALARRGIEWHSPSHMNPGVLFD